MGLVPTFPVIAEVGTSVIPVFVRIAKLPAVPKFTGIGPGACACALPASAESEKATPTIKAALKRSGTLANIVGLHRLIRDLRERNFRRADLVQET